MISWYVDTRYWPVLYTAEPIWPKVGRWYVWRSRAAQKHYFDKPSELEIEYMFFWRKSGKSCRNFYWRKKKWEKQKNGTFGAGNRKSWLHRSPKCSRTSDSYLPYLFTLATMRVCQNIRYLLPNIIRNAFRPYLKWVIFNFLKDSLRKCC